MRFRVRKGAGAGVTQEYFGDSTDVIAAGSARLIGNIYSVSTPTTLREFRSHLVISTATEIRFLVYEGSNAAGPFARIAETAVASPGNGSRFYSSGTINVSLNVGRYYYVGVAYQAAVSASRRVFTLPMPVSFGQMEASGFVGGYPPGASVTPLRSTTNIWTQILLTGFDFVTAIIPDTAAVNSGDSVDVLVRLRASAPMGTISRHARGALE